MTRNLNRSFILVLLFAICSAGCREKDRYREVAEVATQAADRQAEQNSEMARVNREVAEGTRRLVEADAQARKEIITVHQEIQAERATLSDGFDSLETERKVIAQERRTESLLVPAAKALGGTVLVTAVVLLCLVLLVGMRRSDSTDADVSELLISDLVSERPQLFHPSSRLTSSAQALLPAADPVEPNPEGDRE